jgi:hypothetical protein
MPSYDPNPCTHLQPPVNIVDPHSAPSDAGSTVIPVPVPTLTQVTGPYDSHRPQNASPLRQVANVPEQPPLKLQHRLTIANLGTPGGKLVGFPRACQQNLPVPKRVRFRGGEIIVPPMPTFPVPPTAPTENIPAEAQQPLGPQDENTSLNRSVHTPTVFDRETSAADEFPDSPSVYSPTPPNSSAPSANHLSESPRGPPRLAEVNPPVIDIGHPRPSLVQFLGEGSSNKEDTGGPPICQPRGEDRSTSTSKDDSYGKSHRSE